ncbi:uncharacterized protein EDB91DRAFT_1338468, partial [Suillus paluster]|uniref:uncharacterized protein n=1 Tax=Suillus paluster TaxID=48578 RepID=UPI001B85DB1B
SRASIPTAHTPADWFRFSTSSVSLLSLDLLCILLELVERTGNARRVVLRHESGSNEEVCKAGAVRIVSVAKPGWRENEEQSENTGENTGENTPVYQGENGIIQLFASGNARVRVTPRFFADGFGGYGYGVGYSYP